MKNIKSELTKYYLNSKYNESTLRSLLMEFNLNQVLEVASKENIFFDILSKIKKPINLNHELKNKINIYKDELMIRRQLIHKLQNISFTTIFVKSYSIEQYYEKGKSRFCYDLDICVESFEEYFQMFEALKSIGLNFCGQINLLKDRANDRVFASTRFTYNENFSYGVELHMGGFPASMHLYIPWELISHENKKYNMEDYKISIPNEKTSIIVFLAELISRKHVKIRDIYDAILLFKQKFSDDELLFICSQINKFGLLPSLYKLISQFKLLKDVKTPSVLDKLVKLVGFSKIKRHKFLISHIIGYMKNNYSLSFLPVGLLFILSRELINRIHRFYKMRILLRGLDIPKITHYLYKNSFPIYLYLLDKTPRTLKWLQINGYLFMQSKSGTYIAGTSLAYSNNEVENIENLIKEKL